MIHPAGVLRRLAAGLYDGLLLLAIWMVITFAIVVIDGGKAVPPGNLAYQLLLLLVALVFFLSSWLRGGQTLGMRAWRLKVERLSGGPLDWRTAGLRFVVGILSLLAGGLGLFWLWIDRDHLTWHDRAAGTRVILVPKR